MPTTTVTTENKKQTAITRPQRRGTTRATTRGPVSGEAADGVGVGVPSFAEILEIEGRRDRWNSLRWELAPVREHAHVEGGERYRWRHLPTLAPAALATRLPRCSGFAVMVQLTCVDSVICLCLPF